MLHTYRKTHKLSMGSLMNFHKVKSICVTTAQIRGRVLRARQSPSVLSQVTPTSFSLFKKKKKKSLLTFITIQ